MRRLLLAATIWAAGLGLAQAQSDPAADPADVIGAQMEAFLAGDVETAFGYAAPGIKRMFVTPRNFGIMVRRGYPMVWRPAEVRYGARSERGGAVLQTVYITDEAGTLHALEYTMVPDGATWKIAGVRFLEAPEVGV